MRTRTMSARQSAVTAAWLLYSYCVQIASEHKLDADALMDEFVSDVKKHSKTSHFEIRKK